MAIGFVAGCKAGIGSAVTRGHGAPGHGQAGDGLSLPHLPSWWCRRVLVINAAPAVRQRAGEGIRLLSEEDKRVTLGGRSTELSGPFYFLIYCLRLQRQNVDHASVAPAGH
jgi:hypothetical protein